MFSVTHLPRPVRELRYDKNPNIVFIIISQNHVSVFTNPRHVVREPTFS